MPDTWCFIFFIDLFECVVLCFYHFETQINKLCELIPHLWMYTHRRVITQTQLCETRIIQEAAVKQCSLGCWGSKVRHVDSQLVDRQHLQHVLEQGVQFHATGAWLLQQPPNKLCCTYQTQYESTCC